MTDKSCYSLEDDVFARPGKDDINNSEHEDVEAEVSADIRQLHELLEPMRWSEDHIYGN